MKVWNSDYVIRQLDLPYSVKGFVAMSEDGFYNVYVNSRLSAEEQYRAAAHELVHIARGDFYSTEDIHKVEGA